MLVEDLMPIGPCPMCGEEMFMYKNCRRRLGCGKFFCDNCIEEEYWEIYKKRLNG